MNIKKHQKMYLIIRERVINAFMKQLAEMKPTQKQQRKQKSARPLFQLYEYGTGSQKNLEKEVQADYEQVQQKIKRQTVKEFNDYLCEFEQAELQMQMFLLDKQLAIELDEIELLQARIKNFQISKQQIRNEPRSNSPFHIQSHLKDLGSNQTVGKNQDKRSNYNMCLVPNIRVDIVPQRKEENSKTDDKTLKYEELTQLLRRQIQLRTTQQNSFAAKTTKVEIPSINEEKNKRKKFNELLKCQNSILQHKRNWQIQKGESSKESKKKLKQSLTQFWKIAEQF